MEPNAVGPKAYLGEHRRSKVSAPDSGAVLVEESLNKLRERVSRASAAEMQKVAEPSRRGGAVTECLGTSTSWHTRQVPERIQPPGPTRAPNCNNSGSNRSDEKWNPPSCGRRDGPPWKGRKKMG